MNRLVMFLAALRYGNQLADVKHWKQAGVAVATLTAFLSALSGLAVAFGWIPEGVSEEMIMQLSSAIVTIVGVILAYLQVATTKKIGIGHETEALDVDEQEQADVVRVTVDHPVVRMPVQEPKVLTASKSKSGYWADKRRGLDEH
jgi:hypothetical protein